MNRENLVRWAFIVVACAGCATRGPTEKGVMTMQTDSGSGYVVKSDGGEVWIDGIEAWAIPAMPNSVMAAHSTAMRVIGEPDLSYAYLMGASGAAFRMQLHEGWCPSSPHSFCGLQVVRGAIDVLPWHVMPLEAAEDDEEGRRRVLEAVRESIDRGFPVPYGREEDGLIVGYRNDGAEWLCVHPYHGSKERFVETTWPWGVGVYRGRKEPPPDRRVCAEEAIQRAVEINASGVEGDYLHGPRAWDAWIAGLEDDAAFAALDDEALKGRMQGNAWIYTNLVDARRCAAVYLREIAREFARDLAGDSGPEIAARLTAAADIYERMATEILQPRCPTEIAPFPWALPEGGEWTAETRHGQADILRAAAPADGEAVAELTAALTLLR